MESLLSPICVSLSSSLIDDNLVVALQMTGHDSEVHFPELSYGLWSTQYRWHAGTFVAQCVEVVCGRGRTLLWFWTTMDATIKDKMKETRRTREKILFMEPQMAQKCVPFAFCSVPFLSHS